MPGRIFSIVHWTSDAGSSPTNLGEEFFSVAGLPHYSALRGVDYGFLWG